MNAALRIAACVGISASGLAFARPDQQPRPLAITNVTVIDVSTGSALNQQTVVISGERISAVGPSASTPAPKSATVIDGSGKFLIPGLWDMHSHVVGFGRSALALYLANGVTSVRDMGAERFAVAKAWRDSIAAGQLVGPRMRIAGPIVENKNWLTAVKRWNDNAGTPWRLYERYGPSSPEEAVRWVDSVAALGADHIKVRNWPAANLSEAIVTRARERGLQVVAHGNEPFPRKGITTIEHGIWPPLKIDSAARSAMWRGFAENGVALVPTLVTGAIRADPPDSALARISSGRLAGLEYISRATRDNWRDQFLGMKQESPMDWASIQRDDRRNVAEMHRAGVTILAGSDIGAPLLIPGFSLHDEMAQLVSVAGLTPLQALQAATIAPARVMRLDNVQGTIAPGKRADLVLLDRNPLTDISNTRLIRSVVAGGRLYDRGALDKLLSQAKAAARN